MIMVSLNSLAKASARGAYIFLGTPRHLAALDSIHARAQRCQSGATIQSIMENLKILA